MRKITSLYLLIFLLPLISFAHEGHGHTHGFTITHYFVEPEHLAVLIGVVVAGIVYFRYRRKKEKVVE